MQELIKIQPLLRAAAERAREPGESEGDNTSRDTSRRGRGRAFDASTPREDGRKPKKGKKPKARRKLVYSESSSSSDGSSSPDSSDATESSGSEDSSSSSSSGTDQSTPRRKRGRKKRKVKKSTKKKHRRQKRKKEKQRSPVNGWPRRQGDRNEKGHKMAYQREEGRSFYRKLPEPWNKLPEGPPVSFSQLNVIQKFLTKHDGTIGGYQIFRAGFLLSVHTADMAIMAKFMMLRTSVQEVQELSTFLQTLPPCAESYKALIERLEEKYGGMDNLLNHHLSKLRKTPLVFPNRLQEAEGLVDAVEAYRAALDHAGHSDEDTHSHFVLVKNKLSHELRQRYWQYCQASKSRRKYYDRVPTLTKWLKKHVIAPLRLDPAPKARDNRGEDRRPNGNAENRPSTPEGQKREAKWQQRQGRLFVANSEEENCPLCQQKHGISKCPTFLGFTVSERREKIRELNRCYKCLGRGHGVRTCRGYACKICKRSHHISLHDKDYTYKPFNNRRVSFKDGEAEATRPGEHQRENRGHNSRESPAKDLEEAMAAATAALSPDVIPDYTYMYRSLSSSVEQGVCVA